MVMDMAMLLYLVLVDYDCYAASASAVDYFCCFCRASMDLLLTLDTQTCCCEHIM